MSAARVPTATLVRVFLACPVPAGGLEPPRHAEPRLRLRDRPGAARALPRARATARRRSSATSSSSIAIRTWRRRSSAARSTTRSGSRRAKAAPGAPVRYKSTLQGPLAALGDGFFWTALRPFCGALGAVGALLAGAAGVLAALVVYNAVHLAIRAGLFRVGYRGGDAVVPAIARLGLPLVADRLRAAGAALCGVAAAIVVLRSGGAAGAAAGIFAALAAGAGYAALARGARLLPTAYVAALAGIGAAAVAGHFHWSS